MTSVDVWCVAGVTPAPPMRLRCQTLDPRRYRDVVVRTQTGRRLRPDDTWHVIDPHGNEIV